MVRFILWICIFFSCYSLNAQTFNGTGGVIPDGGAQTCFNINVTGVGVINGTYGIASVCINITHTWVGDLEIYLLSPNGTSIPLSLQNGGGGVNYTNTCFTGTAVTPISSGTPPFTGTFLPEDPLGTFNNGQNANGVWQLCIQDLITPDVGDLVNWNILFNNTPAAPPVVPANDDPCNAITIPVGASCSFSNFTNENATATSGVPNPGCSLYSGGDVWFQVTVPAGGALIFDTQTGVITDGGMAIYSGTCNALTLIACDDDASSNGLMPMITAGGLIPGTTVWIRIWEYGNDNQGTFGICVTTPPPPPPNDNPCNAIPLTVNSSCTYSTHTNAGATGTVGVPAPGCGDYQGG
ncbi:MAG: proprotein convertase P-domain-containing protein, partial [Ferruginibacter sp.]